MYVEILPTARPFDDVMNRFSLFRDLFVTYKRSVRSTIGPFHSYLSNFYIKKMHKLDLELISHKKANNRFTVL